MSRLDELIRKLCPDGVSFKPLGEVCILKAGKAISSLEISDECNNETPIPCYGGNGLRGYVKSNNQEGNDPIIGRQGALCGNVCYATGKYYATEHAVVVTDKGFFDSRFLYHILLRANLNQYKSSGAQPGLSVAKLYTILIPVPPMEIQRGIVRILDKFTTLSAELSAELSARQKQYSYYREKLLTFKNEIHSLPLRSVVKHSCSGGTPAKGNSEYYENGTIPWIRTQDVRFNEIHSVESYITEKAVRETSAKWIPENCVIVAISGASAGRCAINKIRATTNQHCLNMEIDPEKALYRYVYHCVCTKYQELLSKKQGARGDLNSTLILDTQIPVPSLSVQQRIVNVLDNFDTICSDLQIGLPAEIEARQKQYEYYRDLLLTFDDADSIISRAEQSRAEQSRAEQSRADEYNALIRLCQYVYGYVLLPMGDLFEFRNGLSKGKEFFGRGTSFIRFTDVYNNRFLKKENINALVECTSAEIEKLRVSRGDVLFTRTSETAEDVGWSSVVLDDVGDCVFNGFTIKATPKTNYLLPEYCVYCFAVKDFRQYVSSHCSFTTRASLTGKTIAEYRLVVPSIDEQRRIVDILSKLHSLCNDLSAGLPAEIEARNKQYEYYRDKLLSFEPLK